MASILEPSTPEWFPNIRPGISSPPHNPTVNGFASLWQASRTQLPGDAFDPTIRRPTQPTAQQPASLPLQPRPQHFWHCIQQYHQLSQSLLACNADRNLLANVQAGFGDFLSQNEQHFTQNYSLIPAQPAETQTLCWEKVRYKLALDDDVNMIKQRRSKELVSELQKHGGPWTHIVGAKLRYQILTLYVEGPKMAQEIHAQEAVPIKTFQLSANCQVIRDVYMVTIIGYPLKTRKHSESWVGTKIKNWSEANHATIFNVKRVWGKPVLHLLSLEDALRLCAAEEVMLDGVPCRTRSVDLQMRPGNIADDIHSPRDPRETPLFCKRCSRPGHRHKECTFLPKGKWCCGRCKGDHESTECDGKSPERCVNCDGPHTVWNKSCQNQAVKDMHADCQRWRHLRPEWARGLPKDDPPHSLDALKGHRKKKRTPKKDLRRKDSAMWPNMKQVSLSRTVNPATAPIFQATASSVEGPSTQQATVSRAVASTTSPAGRATASNVDGPNTEQQVAITSTATADPVDTVPTCLRTASSATSAEATPQVATNSNQQKRQASCSPTKPSSMRNKKQLVVQGSGEDDHIVDVIYVEDEIATVATTASTSLPPVASEGVQASDQTKPAAPKVQRAVYRVPWQNIMDKAKKAQAERPIEKWRRKPGRPIGSKNKKHGASRRGDRASSQSPAQSPTMPHFHRSPPTSPTPEARTKSKSRRGGDRAREERARSSRGSDCSSPPRTPSRISISSTPSSLESSPTSAGIPESSNQSQITQFFRQTQ